MKNVLMMIFASALMMFPMHAIAAQPLSDAELSAMTGAGVSIAIQAEVDLAMDISAFELEVVEAEFLTLTFTPPTLYTITAYHHTGDGSTLVADNDLVVNHATYGPLTIDSVTVGGQSGMLLGLPDLVVTVDKKGETTDIGIDLAEGLITGDLSIGDITLTTYSKFDVGATPDIPSQVLVWSH